MIRKPWPGMLRGICGDRERYVETYWSRVDGMYTAGDGAKRDDEGYFWIIGRSTTSSTSRDTDSARWRSRARWSPTRRWWKPRSSGVPHEIKGTGIAAFVTLAPAWRPTTN